MILYAFYLTKALYSIEKIVAYIFSMTARQSEASLQKSGWKNMSTYLCIAEYQDDEIRDLLAIMGKRYDYLNTNSNAEKQFITMVSKKNVNIIGPLKTQGEFRKKNGELNVCFNAREDQNFLTIYNPRITYLNEYQYSYMVKNNIGIWPSVIFCIVPAKIFIHSKSYFSIKNPAVIVRTQLNDGFFKCFRYGGLNGIQRVCLDILPYEPKKLSILQSDLMLSYGEGKNEIAYRQPGGVEDISRMFIFHEPALNFDFLYDLWCANIVSCDEKLKRILSNGRESYLKSLEQKLGGFKGEVRPWIV